MTEKTVTISITTEVNGKAHKQEISVGSAGLDGELIKMMAELMRTIIAEGLEAIDITDGHRLPSPKHDATARYFSLST